MTESEFQTFMRSLRDKPYEVAGKTYYPPRDRVTCADGFTISIQAGWGKYSLPRSDYDGDYAQWEYGFPSETPLSADLLLRAEDPSDYTGTVYGYVPTEIVIAELEAHGGVQRSETVQ